MALKGKVDKLSRDLKIELKGLNKPRVDLIISAVLSMSLYRSINLVKVASNMIGTAEKLSKYRRLQRFISEISWSKVNLPKLLLKISGQSGPLILLIDRTNWKFGKTDVNYLVISILCSGYSIPIKWMTLTKRGNSTLGERISLLEELIEDIGIERIKNIIGDREFIGEHWIQWLTNNDIGYILRIKSNMDVICKGKKYKARALVNRKRASRPLSNREVKLQGVDAYLHGYRFKNSKGKWEDLIIMTQDPNENAIEQYGDRWYVENMFKNFKTNGFDLMSTHITDPDRLDTLFGLVSIALTWMSRIGQWLKSKQPNLFKKLKHGRPKVSVFRAGIDLFNTQFVNSNNRELWILFRFLSCTLVIFT